MDLQILDYDGETGVATVVRSEALINYISDDKPTKIQIFTDNSTIVGDSDVVYWFPKITDAVVAAPYIVVDSSFMGCYGSYISFEYRSMYRGRVSMPVYRS